MKRKKADVLVITPHPDDAEFGVAGTVAHWFQLGKEKPELPSQVRRISATKKDTVFSFPDQYSSETQ